MTDMIANLVVRMGMFAAVGIVSIGGGWYWDKNDDVSASSIIVLVFVCATVFWVIGLAVEVAADTIVVCYLEDTERHDGDRNYRGPDSVRDAITKARDDHTSLSDQKKLQPYGGDNISGAA